MKTMFAALALGLAAPAIAAQPPAAPPPTPPPARPAEEAVDPSRLAAAQRMMDAMMPPGTFRRAIAGAFGGMDSIFDMNMGMFGVEGEEADTSFGEAAAEGDPHFRERMRISNQVAAEAMSELMGNLEPDFLRFFARYYALRFTVAELDEMTAFFVTSTGRKYAEVSMFMMSDPVFMQGMVTTLMPRMVEEFPRIEERIRAATAHLPPPPSTANPDADEDADED